MPRLPAAGAGVAGTDFRSGVKADLIMIFSFPGSPALCLPVGRQGRGALLVAKVQALGETSLFSQFRLVCQF